MESATSSQPVHLVVFQHGLLGNESDFANFQELFKRHVTTTSGPHDNNEPIVLTHSATCNTTSLFNWFQTCDGIDHGGERLAHEIVRVVKTLAPLQVVTKFSMVSHSMGGLYARYALGVLYARGFFTQIEPMNFITLATPHLGSRRPPRSAINLIFNSLMPTLFDRTGNQFALLDTASAETIALSKSAENKYPHRVAHGVCRERHGVLSVRLGSSSSSSSSPSARTDPPPPPRFALHFCDLRDGVLSIYQDATDKESLLTQAELVHAQITVVLPDPPSPSFTSYWDILIHVPGGSRLDPLCTLRLETRTLHSHWKWIVALSNATNGNVQCCTSSTSSSPPPLPLVACLARGQFMQALHLFQARTLYATIANDLQVPYSCAAIRAFNPYRHRSMDSPFSWVPWTPPRSPWYPHLIHKPLEQVPRLRDTSNQQQQRLVEREQGQLQPMAPSSGSSSGRPAPFTERELLLDRVDHAFASSSDDETQDLLRGLLISMQSVGWRRVDVHLDSVFAHEMIIAKRATASQDHEQPLLDGGLDIIHHVMDTFLL